MVRFVEMLVCRIDRRHALHSMATVVGFDRVRRAHALLQVQEELTESNQNGRRSNEEGGRRKEGGEGDEEGQREDKGENCSGSGCSQSEPPSSVDCARCRNTEDCMIATTWSQEEEGALGDHSRVSISGNELQTSNSISSQFPLWQNLLAKKETSSAHHIVGECVPIIASPARLKFRTGYLAKLGRTCYVGSEERQLASIFIDDYRAKCDVM